MIDLKTTYNHLITGVPRSGTSLLLSLLQSDHRLCFSEPPWLRSLRESSNTGSELAINLKSQIAGLRQSIKKGEAIEMVVKKDSREVPDNYFPRSQQQRKKQKNTAAVVYPEHMATADFFIKANAVFTANLQPLLASVQWQVTAVIRDPLSVLMSWRSVNIASSKGRVKSVEKYSQHLREIGQTEPLLKRQVLLLDWYFQQYANLEETQVIRYESLVANPEQEIKRTMQQQVQLKKELKSHNKSSMYDEADADMLASQIKKYATVLKDFYPAYS